MISAQVAALTEGVMKAMLLNKLVKATAALAGLVVLAMGLIGAGMLSSGAAGEKRNELNEGRLQEVLVQHPKPVESAPTEQFTGRLGKRQSDSVAVTFAVDERSYLRYQRLLQKHQVEGPGSPVQGGLADEDGFSHKGTLKGFDDRIDPETGTVQTHATLPDPDGFHGGQVHRTLLNNDAARFDVAFSGDEVSEGRKQWTHHALQNRKMNYPCSD